jgi:hypothetical protein
VGISSKEGTSNRRYIDEGISLLQRDIMADKAGIYSKEGTSNRGHIDEGMSLLDPRGYYSR